MSPNYKEKILTQRSRPLYSDFGKAKLISG